jgi:hypothetical protein
VKRHPDFPSRVSGRDRTFPVRRCLQWQRDRIVADAIADVAPPAPSNIVDAELRKAIADAELAELKVARMRGDLVAVQVAAKEIRDAFSRVRARLLSTPGEYAPQILHLEEMPKAVVKLRSSSTPCWPNCRPERRRRGESIDDGERRPDSPDDRATRARSPDGARRAAHAPETHRRRGARGVSAHAQAHRVRVGRREPHAAVDERRAGALPHDRIPYLRKIQDALGDETVGAVVFAKSAQVAGSTAGENFVGFLIDHSPCAILEVWPTEKKLNAWSLTRLDPMLQDTPALAKKFPRSGRREAGNSLDKKIFPGGWLMAITAKSTSDLKSSSARVAIAEEVDEWEGDVGDQGDPLALLRVRLRHVLEREALHRLHADDRGPFARLARARGLDVERVLGAPARSAASIRRSAGATATRIPTRRATTG